MRKTPFRQIHMDFHTSPLIEKIGSAFDRETFGRTLAEAHVESVNLFAKCHHGFYYYPSAVGRMHPQLSFNLLREQIESCRAAGVRTAIYTCVGWSEDTAHTHPEWQEVGMDGILGHRVPFTRAATTTSWQKLCLNNQDYRSYMRDEFAEIVALFHPETLWIDIVFQQQCLCETCMRDMIAHGMDPASEIDRIRHDRRVQIDYMREMFGVIQILAPGTAVYFNGHPYEMDLADDPALTAGNKRKYNTFIDIESLPSEMWGYSHFPIAVNYVNKYEQDVTMMNGKFHLSWGDFGSIRNIKALEYECFRALAHGAGCCVGDQLHPDGRIDAFVYKRIGAVYNAVAWKEKWCRETRKVAQIGVFTTRRAGIESPLDHNRDLPVEGACRMLDELHYTYDILNLRDDLSRYDCLILPDKVWVDEASASRIGQYLRGGGRAIATGTSTLDKETGHFLLEALGVDYRGMSRFTPRYMRLDPDALPSVEPMDHVVYEPGVDVVPLPGATCLSEVVHPYFNRGETAFCSHRQTPPDRSRRTGLAAVVENGRTAYVAQPLFTDYAVRRCQPFRNIVSDLLHRLGVTPIVESDLPSTVEMTLRETDDAWVIHLLHYAVERKSRTIDTVEASIPTFDSTLSVQTGWTPARVTLVEASEETDLPFSFPSNGKRFIINVPRFDGHAMILIHRP